jgi:hypothetical protein
MRLALNLFRAYRRYRLLERGHFVVLEGDGVVGYVTIETNLIVSCPTQ